MTKLTPDVKIVPTILRAYRSLVELDELEPEIEDTQLDEGLL